jgi:predicted RNase H-like nuclease (RuvC/YqgF family)
LEAKSIELEQANSRINKQKSTYEDTINFTKKENEMLRNKLVEV